MTWALAALVWGCSPSLPGRVCTTPAPVASGGASRPAEVPKQPASEHVDGVAAVSPLERYYPGSDDARTATPLKRYTTAVVLFAPPRPEPATPLERIETLSFQPVVCVIAGRIQTGVRCGEVMPRRTTVRLTAASSGYDTMEIMRSTTPFTSSPEDGTVTFPAPYAPACCMYKGCAGKTIPYRPAERQGSALATSRTILAVWPEDADIDLVPLTPETDDPSTHPWKAERSGARKFLQLATSDLDRDGRPEILVYELWANDYGLDVFANGSQEPIYRFSCGNI